MSGIATAITASNSLIFGQGGPVVLNDFVFADFEVPARITWGGAQHVNVHKLVGGIRVIDALGRDDAPIAWSGWMIGPDASVRADELDQMRVAGQPVPLLFTGRSYTVVVTNFRAQQLKQYHVKYDIECTVQTDGTDNGGGTSPELLAQMNDDINAAIAIQATAEMATIVNDLLAIKLNLTAIGSITELVVGTAVANDLFASVISAQEDVGATQAVSDATIAATTAGAIATGVVLGTVHAGQAVANMNNAGQAALTAASCVAINAYLGVCALNLVGA